MYRGETISTKNKTFLLLILSLLILAMASVSASDVSDINENQNFISVSDDLASDNLDNLDFASDDSNSVGSNSDLVSSPNDVSDTNAESSISQDSDVESSLSNSDGADLADSDSSSEAIKNATAIQSSASKVVKGNNYSVTLKDKNGNVLSGKKLIFTFDGKNYTKTTDSNGIASLTLNSKPAKYLIKVSFLGDDLYESSSFSQKVTISKSPTTIKNVSVEAVNGKSYSVALKNQNGNPVSSKEVTLKFNGKTYKKTTNAKGIVKITLRGTVGKTYKLTYKFAGDSSYLASSGSASFKLKRSTKFVGSNARILRGGKYNITLMNANNKPLAKKKVTVLFNGKTYKKTTNAKGIVRLTLKPTPGKTYKLTYKYAGNSNLGASSKTVSVYVKVPTKLVNSGSAVSRGSVYHITLKDYKGKALAKKNVRITYNGRTYKKKTNAKGVVGLKINTNITSVNKLSYRFAGNKNYGPSSGSVNLRTKMGTHLTGSSATIIKGKYYKVTLKDKAGKALSKRTVTFVINGKKYKKTTNSKGIASIKINLAAGKKYKLSYKYAGTKYYNKASGKINLAVKLATSIKNSGSSAVNNSSYVVTLKDSSSKALANKTITFTLDGKTYKNTTDENGVASLFISEDRIKTAKFTYKFAGDSLYNATSGSISLKVKSDKVFSFNQIVAAAKTLRKYVEKNGKLPSTVSVNGISVNITSFAYLMSKSVVNINNSKKSNVYVVPVSSSYSNNGNATINGNLYKAGYLELATKVISYTESNHAIPNYVNTSLGSLSPNLYIFGLSKSLDFYSANKYLPNYLILDSDDVSAKSGTGKGNSSQYKKGLNEVQTLSASQLSKYLVASGNDAYNAAIQTLAKKLVSGKTTAWAKANAIFTYVRDNIDYEYYADTRYKATGTYSKKKGNCCDHANLIVSLCRAAKIPARFSHAQGCTFSSGLVTGHVWAQIYVDGVWYSADATSSRNSLGNIHNWNTKYYNTFKRYYHLSF